MSKQDFRGMIEERVKEEKEAAELLHESIKKTDNPVIRLLLHQIALDSAKHERMLQAVLSFLDSPSSMPSCKESGEFNKIIEKHVEIEREMLGNFEKIVDLAKDKRIRFILEDIISDEKRHHAVIRRIHQLVCEGEKVKDEKWWDFLYRYSRLTG